MSKKKRKSKKRGHVPSMAELRKVGEFVKITPASGKKKETMESKAEKKPGIVTDKHGREWDKRDIRQMSGIEKDVLGIGG